MGSEDYDLFFGGRPRAHRRSRVTKVLGFSTVFFTLASYWIFYSKPEPSHSTVKPQPERGQICPEEAPLLMVDHLVQTPGGGLAHAAFFRCHKPTMCGMQVTCHNEESEKLVNEDCPGQMGFVSSFVEMHVDSPVEITCCHFEVVPVKFKSLDCKEVQLEGTSARRSPHEMNGMKELYDKYNVSLRAHHQEERMKRDVAGLYNEGKDERPQIFKYKPEAGKEPELYLKGIQKEPWGYKMMVCSITCKPDKPVKVETE